MMLLVAGQAFFWYDNDNNLSSVLTWRCSRPAIAFFWYDNDKNLSCFNMTLLAVGQAFFWYDND